MDFRVTLSIRPTDTTDATRHTYPDRPPIMVIQAGADTFTITGTADTDPALLVGFARQLRDAATTYAHAIEHATGNPDLHPARPRPLPRRPPR